MARTNPTKQESYLLGIPKSVRGQDFPEDLAELDAILYEGGRPPFSECCPGCRVFMGRKAAESGIPLE